jgi:predicted DNA-binding transcriptional regulator AlpA
MPKQFLRKSQVAARYGVHERTIDRMADDGRIPKPIHRGKFPLWAEDKLEAYERRAVIEPNLKPEAA